MERGRGSILVAAAAGSSNVQLADEAEQRAVSVLEKCALFTMTFGPGAAIASYVNLFGWYQQAFHSSEVLVWMRIAMFTPYPIMKMLQGRYDTYFDELFGTRTAYFFRVVIMQLVVAALMVLWMFLPVSVAEYAPIVGFGVVLGTFTAPFIGSSVQIAVAMDPTLSVYAQLGNNVGMALPTIAIYAMGFSPASSHNDLLKVLAVPLTVCILTAGWLGYLHHAGVFSNAFLALTQRRSSRTSQASEGIANPQDDIDSSPMEESASAGSQVELLDVGRDDVEGLDSDSSDRQQGGSNDDAMPRWVWFWFASQSLCVTLDQFLLTLIGYFGEPSSTQHLAAISFVAGPLGRILALLCPFIPAFEKGPLHISGAALCCIRIGLWVLLLLKLAKAWMVSFDVVLAVWVAWNLVSMLHMSVIDITVTSNLSGAKRQRAAQYGLIVTYSSLFVGLITASTVVLASEESILP